MDKTECPIITDWQEMKAEFRAAVAKVDGVHLTVGETNKHVVEILEHVRHLEKLDVIAQVLGRIARHLLCAVIVAMAIFGGLLTMYVVRDSSTLVHATGPGGTSFHVEGQPG